MPDDLYEEDTTTTTSESSDDRAPVLAVDMDETIIQSDTEELVPGAKDALQELRDKGWKIIIWTCRGDVDDHIHEILRRHGIPYDAVNENLPGVKDKSRKIHFDAVVDNKNVDFHDGWESVVDELETRRKGWQSKGITKASVYYVDPRTGKQEVIQEWGLDESGSAVLLSGDLDAVEFDVECSVTDGVEFLKQMERSVNNTYLFAEVARGEQFLFAPKQRANTVFDDNGYYCPVFEGLPAGTKARE